MKEIILDESLIARFWEKVTINEDGCWDWTAHQGFWGYGVIWAAGTMQKAHRVSWAIHNGAIRPGTCVLHHCDNPPCTRPDHLYLGSLQDNMDDMVRRGRGNAPRGENNKSAKLTEAQVRLICAELKTGVSQPSIAARYNISTFQINAIKNGHAWRHITQETSNVI